MNQHLTDQQLIDYQFKLAEEAGLAEARAHLEQCEPCRRRLEGLVRKFAALDLLREEIKVPEALLSRTVENAVRKRGMGILPMSGLPNAIYRVWGLCRRAILALPAVVFHGRDARDTHGQDAHATMPTASPARRRRIVLYRVPALGAVAAAVIAGFALLLVSDSSRDKRIVPTETSEQVAQEIASAPGRAEAYAFDKDRLSSAEAGGVRRDGLAPQAKPEPITMAAVASQPAEREQVPEQPPFAPASAIELVVLPRRENVQLTIYNGADLTLVRERRNLTLKRGWNWLQFMWANTLIDPTSLSLEPLEHKEAVQVQQLVFPPRLRELGRWLIRSEIDGQAPFELTYFTSGLAWRAFYMGTLSPDEKTMRLEGYVRVNNNSGEDYEDAQTRLVVGRVHLLDQIAELAKRQYPYGSPVHTRKGVRASDVIAIDEIREKYTSLVSYDWAGSRPSLKPKEIHKEGLSEYFLYTIDGTETIPNQWGKRLLSFEANEIPVTSLYKYDEERWGRTTIRFLSFANDEKHKLGETPIPDGAVRVYGQSGGQGHLSYVGAMDVKYIPVGEEVELNLGPARLVEVKPVLVDYRIENHAFDNNGNISGWDDVRTWRIEIANTRSLAVEIEVTRRFETPYWTLRPASEGVSYTKHDATHARFKLAVEPHSKRVFEYTVTTYHGVRQEVLSNAK